MFQASVLAAGGLAAGLPQLTDGALPVSLYHIPSAHTCQCIQFPRFIRTPLYWVRDHPNDIVLVCISARTLFPDQVTFTGPGDSDANIFWGDTIQPIPSGTAYSYLLQGYIPEALI